MAAPGAAIALAALVALTPTAQAAPQRVIVEFDRSAADHAAAQAQKQRGLPHEDRAIVDLRARYYADAKRPAQAALQGRGAAPERDLPHLPLSVWQVSGPEAIARLRALPSVRAVYPDRLLHAGAAPSDLALIEQPAAQAAGATGAGAMTVVIDTGIDLTNPAFGTCSAGAGSAGCRVLYNQTYHPGSGTDPTHGTNVSGIAAEVAPASTLAMHNVFSGANAASSDILTAIDWAIANQSAYRIAAVNMSLGDGMSYTAASCPPDFGAAASSATAAGITLVAASGNNAYRGGISFPACTSGIVSVGMVYDTALSGVAQWGAPVVCTDTNPAVDQVACATNIGPALTLLAPGVNVVAAGIGESGTSQATPHVSGSITGLRARYPNESLAQTLLRLTSSGTPDSLAGYSAPRIDLFRALSLGAALSLSGSGPSVATAGATATYTLTVTNNGPLAATSVVIKDSLPALAAFVSATGGCSATGAIVTCPAGSLAAGASASFTISVRWTGSGPVYDLASVSADQADPAPAGSSLAFGSAPEPSADVPVLPAWASAALAIALLRASRRRAA